MNIWLANFDPKVGAEQGAIRPAVILQNDLGNRYGNTTIVAALTTTLRKMPVHVFLGKKDGVKESSMLLLEQIHTFDKKTIKKLGKVNKGKFGEIDRAIRDSLGLSQL